MRVGRIARMSLILLAFSAIPASAQTPVCDGLVATIVGTAGNDQLHGTPGDDVIAGLGGNDVIRGEGGHDVICGGPGNDTLFGGAGNDRLIGGDGNDSIHAGEGDDFLDGAGGRNNTLHGDEGWDTCINGKPHKCESDGETQNHPPLADAGADQTVFVGDTVTLNGSASSDADGDPITYRWTLIGRPDGSTAALINETSANPTFVVDRFGSYAIELIVNDGTADSAPDTVAVVTTNSPPVANAGPDQSAPVTAIVTLDGSASTDVDGDPLTYAWSLGMPGGSAAALSSATALNPTFTIDVPGEYVALLVVNDGHTDSEADSVTISTTNSSPVADAGDDQSVTVGTSVTLDGAGSADVDRDPLTFQWSLISTPPGSGASLINATTATPEVVIDLPGTYIAQLIVSDGRAASQPDTVSITTINSAPIADAGPDGSGHLHQPVQLDGSASRDADADPLTYRWSITSRPPNSNATVADDMLPIASIIPDAHGTYVMQLIVNDGTVDGAPDTVTITTINTPPVADAGTPQTVDTGDTVTLSGTGSDADGDMLTFHWSLAPVPDGSTATLSSAQSPSPSFDADRPGEYMARLVTNDSRDDSEPSFVTITALAPRIELVVAGNALIGVGRSTQVQVILPRPPSNPVTVTVASDVPQVLSVAAPGTVVIPAGATSAMLTVNGVAPGPAMLTGTATDYSDGTVALTVTDKLVNLPDGFSVPLGQQANLLVSISPQPAPASGAVIQLTTSDESVIAVSASVTILPGQFSANAIVTGVRPGSAIVTAINPDYATDSTVVNTAAQLNITAGSITFAAGFTGNITIQLQSSGATVPAPSPGIPLTITSANPLCAVPTAPTLQLATGLSTITTAVAHGSGTTFPCTTTVTASSPGVTPDSVTVTVNPKPAIALTTDLPTTIGSGQMTANLRAFLAIGGHGGATVTFTSNNPNVLVSPNAGTVGAQSITVTIPTNTIQVNFTAHALEGFVGSATITASEPRFTSTTGTVTVVQPAIAMTLATGGIETLAANRNFAVLYGVPSGTSVSLRSVRAGGMTVNVTVSSSNPAIGDLVLGGTTAGSIIAPITAGNSQTSPLQFHPKTAGLTTVSITASGVLTMPAGIANMTVTTPTISLTSDLPATIGSGQMTANLRAFLSAGNHGGASVTISSNNPNVLVSPNPGTVGTPSIVVTIPTNTIQVNFTAHALEGFTGSATITASEPRFTGTTGTVTVVQPAIALTSIATGTTIDTLAFNRNFTVVLGIPFGTGVSSRSVRAGSPGVNVTITSGNAAVGDLVLGATTAASITTAITAGNAQTPTLQFHPKTAGQTTVSIAAPDVITTPLGTATVTVTAPTLSLSTDLPQTIGSGQMTANLRAFLSAGNHGGASVTISSNNPNVLVSPNAGTVGTPSIVITIPNNTIQVNFIAHALEGFTGSATITASEPRFTSGAGTVNVVQPAIVLNGIANGTTIDTLDPNRSFRVLYGIPSGTSVLTRNVRAGGATVDVTVTSSNPAAGDLVSGGTTAATITVPITAGTAQSANQLFHPVAEGQTTVTIAAAGVITAPLGTATVTVTTPGISLSTDLPTTVGAGLQTTNRRAFLGASNHGGAVVRIESSNPAIALVSPNTTTAGSAFILVNVPNGQTQVNFIVQGVEGADGNVVITASSPRFSDGQATATVVPAAIRLAGLSTTATAGGADDVFVVQVGVPNADGSNLTETQTVRGGGEMIVTVTSSAPGVGGLVSGAGTTGSLIVSIGANQSQSANLSLRPLAAGTATVAVTAPNGVITTGAGTVGVTVSP